MKPRELKLPKLRGPASFTPGTLNDEERTVKLTWYSGAPVLRFNYWDGETYELAFSMEPSAIRMGRITSGAPLLNSHNNYDLAGVIGVVEAAAIEGGKGVATVRFSPREDVEPIYQDVRGGIIRNVSMGAVIHQMKEVTEKGDSIKRFLAIDWEPMEVSLVPIGADPGAQSLSVALSAQHETFACVVTPNAAPPLERNAMKIKVRLLASNEIVEIEEAEFDEQLHSKELTSPKVPDTKAAKRLVDDALERNAALATEIKRVAAAYDLDVVWAQRHIRLGTPIEQVIDLAATERASRAPKMVNDIGFGDDHESTGWRRTQMGIALAARASHQAPPESARQYANMTLVEMALECLSWQRLHIGLDARRDAAQIIELALTTSDYPNLLANAANKILLADYEKATPTYRLLAERMDLPDFKTASVLKVGDFPVPLQVAEEGEIKLGAFSEAKDVYALATYGRRLLFSFQSIVNDDLNAFARVMRSAAVRLADYENALWFTLFTSASGAGPTLGDTGALFNATAVSTPGGHANLTSSGTAISIDSLGVGRAAMRKQVSLDGLKLNLSPKYLLVSPDKEGIARQFTTPLGPNLAAGSQNPWAGMMEPLVDANLAGNPWYLLADPARAPISVYGYLNGMSGPSVATRQGFEVLGVEMRVALHFGIAFMDFRGGYRNAGA